MVKVLFPIPHLSANRLEGDMVCLMPRVQGSSLRLTVIHFEILKSHQKIR